MKLDLSKYFFNSNFTIAKNYKFLDGIYTTKCKEYLSQMRFIMYKLNRDDHFYKNEREDLENNKEKNQYFNENEKILQENIQNQKSTIKRTFIPNKDIETEANKCGYENLDFIQKDIFLNEKQRKNLLKVLYSNYVNLGNYANKYEDKFINELVESTKNEKIDNDKYINDINLYKSKKELLNYIEDNKHDILFEIFYNYDIFKDNYNEKKKKSLLRTLISHLLSEIGDIWFEYFNQNYSVTDPDKKDFVNQIKAINYLLYNIKKEDYPRAYSCFSNIHSKNNLIYKIKKNIEVMAKNQILCDIVENHIDASQYYKERKKNKNYKM